MDELTSARIWFHSSCF